MTHAHNDNSEVQKFSALASQWWDGEGFSMLHKINPVRVQYILQHLSAAKKLGKHINLLDIGCGGGILTESMAALGMSVSGLDPSEESISVASKHAASCGLDIKYYCSSIEEFSNKSELRYDVITMLEVAEHVTDVEHFLENVSKLLKKGGMLFLSTLNRTIDSMIFGLLAAEYILRWVPKGTHSWKKFLKPSEIEEILYKNGITIKDITGINYKILQDKWELGDKVNVNYILAAEKIRET